MNKIKVILVFGLLAVFCFGENPLKISIISDIHFLSPSLMDKGVAVRNYEKASAKNVCEVPEILHEVLADSELRKSNVLLVSGDLTKDGELQSHLDLAQKFDSLKKIGVQVFVIPGNHDISVPQPNRYEGDRTIPTKNISPEDFVRIYRDCGFSQAFSRDTASLSYAVALDPTTWLICIDSNRYKEYTTQTISAGRILPQTEQWILDLLKQAKQKNIHVFGMMHHGLVEHFKFQNMFFPGYVVADWQRLASLFADNGMMVIFTGHFHANDITEFDSPSGNKIYDIETGSLSSFPFPYRRITWNGSSLDINTSNIRSIPGIPNLAVQDSIEKLNYATNAAKARLKAKISFLPEQTINSLAQLIGKYYVMHVRGDETMDADFKKQIEQYSSFLGGSDVDTSSFPLDFPPADNNVKIDF